VLNELDRRDGDYPRALWLALVVALAVRLMIAWLPVQELIMRFNADDAYYYLTIARNVVAGRGVSFDGIALTNGFHPLYLLLLLPLFWATSSAVELNVHLALSLLAICNVLTALPLYTTVKRLWHQEAALIAAIAWLLNPWVMAITLMGVESALYVLLMAWTLCVYMEWRSEHKISRLIAAGVLAGLTILARTDGIFLAVALAIDLLSARYGNEKGGWRALMIFGSFAGIVFLPWLLWNWLTFGTVAQTSGMAILYAQYEMPPTVLLVFSSIQMFLLTLILLMFQGSIIVLALLITAIVLHKEKALSRGMDGERAFGRVLVIYAVLWFTFYAVYFRHRQLWYFLPMVFIATLSIGKVYRIWQVLLPRAFGQLRFAVLVFYGVTFVLSLWFWESNRLAFYSAQANGYIIAQWVSANTEPQARIGTWNAGVVGYLSTRTIVNLDGVVNNELYRYVSERRARFHLRDLRDYIIRQRISYVTDYEGLCDEATVSEISWIAPVFEFPSRYGACQVRVYRILREQ